LSFAQRLREIRDGFETPFWVANVTEIFERLSYYAVFAVLVRYLNEALHFPIEQATLLGGWFGAGVWIMALFGGALADRIGFRRALSLAYLILTIGYFLVGSISAPWLAPVRNVLPLGLIAAVILFLPALGVALVKPSVVGTVARASKPSVRSIGYSIYYTMVNIGSTFGPLLAGWAQDHLRPESMFRVAAGSVFLMFVAVLIFFREPRTAGTEKPPSIGTVARNFLTVLSNGRFVLFLLIFSGYWIVFWQQYLTLPSYLVRYVNAKANTGYILATDPLIVITFTVAVNAATRKIPAFRAVILGTVITALGWVFLALRPSVLMAVFALVFVAFGEIIQSPRYYEYISRLAPPGQQGTYMGFAFLPIGIGSIVAGLFSGRLMNHFGEVRHQPENLWWVMTGIGVLTALLLWVYDRVVQPPPAVEAEAKAA
jgi:proton-dependent oligopeptide transporter, POT family